MHEVSSTPKLKFSGYPSGYVIPSTNSGDYETTKENVRTYAFLVRLFYETKHTGVGEALSRLEKVSDSVLDAFDDEDQKGTATRTIGIGLPAAYTFLNVWAVPTTWGELPEDALVMTELSVRVRVSVDVS